MSHYLHFARYLTIVYIGFTRKTLREFDVDVTSASNMMLGWAKQYPVPVRELHVTRLSVFGLTPFLFVDFPANIAVYKFLGRNL